MTIEEFDKKYRDYLEDGHYGLDINNLEVIEYLDQIFQDLIKFPEFKYSQIKTKFNTSRCYTNIPGKLGRIIEGGIESDIDKILNK